ncbi:protein phosphatase 2C domain-containing protein [Candidatus Parabeggiatoa sp. HSG14]|uniref:protein phosphatase 2C domain-containing protein n=1 Tax=Candidatus Parabeggiatoa sp. HSG14 TaxID=3055593 RepID=UPI0025A7EB7C|nr:protein phosphatase 2C domain-containing protein [Thiotrichales bacterium HSG14]
MRLYYDYFYTIGATHKVCEDYATQGHTAIPFVVLSDGCSSSHNTKIGAQILTTTTKYMIENSTTWPLDYINFGQQLIKSAQKVAKKVRLNRGGLDATVMLAFVQEKNIMVYVYGDGCLLFKDYNNNIGTIEIIFTHNAPFYLTYWQDEERLLDYAIYEPNPLLLIDSVNGQSEPKPFNTQLVFSFPLEKFKTVAIASDGASACFDTNQLLKIPLHEVATHLLAFEDLTGEFLKRHAKKALAQYAQQDIFPIDDLSIGVLVAN